MKNSEIIEKLKILGIYSSKQLIEKDIDYWWQLQYQISKNDQENLYLLNEALTDLNEIENEEIISTLNANNSSDNQSEGSYFSRNSSDNQEEDELSLGNNTEVADEYLQKALNSIEEQNFDNAVKEASLGIDFDKANGELYATRCYAMLNSPTSYKNNLMMLHDINKALDLDPTYADFYEIKAQLLFEIVYDSIDYIPSEVTPEDIKKLKLAKKNINMAIKIDEKEGEEDDLTKYSLRGRIKLFSGDIEGGRQDIIKAINLSQNDQESVFNQKLSLVLNESSAYLFQKYFGDEYMKIIQEQNISNIQKRNLLTMEKDLTLAIELHKDNITAYFLRGRVKKLLNKNEASTRDFKIVGVKDPEDNFGFSEKIEEIESTNNFFWKLNQWLTED